MRTFEILIAGGGIAGLAGALAAVQAGHRVRLYERAPQFSEIGAGVQLGPNVVRVLRDWGLEPALQEVVARPGHLDVRHALHGGLLGTLRLSEFDRRYGAPYFTIHRADLHRILLDALRQSAAKGLWLNQGRKVLGYHETAEAVLLRLDDELEVEGDALLGADGLWSGVRGQLLAGQHARVHVGAAPRVTGHLAYRALVKQSDLPAALRSSHVTTWLGPKLHVVHYPVRGGEWLNVVAIVENSRQELVHGALDDWDHAANADDLRAHLAQAAPALKGLIHAIDAWRLWMLCDRRPLDDARQMAHGRVALLGDAAHPMLPYLAQGAGMAIEDAAELGRLLQGAGDLLDMPQLLHRYALNRWKRNARVQERAIRNGQIFHLQGWQAAARDAALRLFGERLLDIPWLYSE